MLIEETKRVVFWETNNEPSDAITTELASMMDRLSKLDNYGESYRRLLLTSNNERVVENLGKSDERARIYRASAEASV